MKRNLAIMGITKQAKIPIFVLSLFLCSFLLSGEAMAQCNPEGISCGDGLCNCAETVETCPDDCTGFRWGLGEPMELNNYKYGWSIDDQVNQIVRLSPDIFRMWMGNDRCLSSPTVVNTAGCANVKKAVTEITAHGIPVVGMAARKPQWMTGLSTWGEIPRRNMTPGSQYQQFLDNYEDSWYTLAEYFPEIDVWETGNEYNHYPFMRGPDDYHFSFIEKANITTDMMYRSYRAIKQANPDALIFMPSMASVDADENIILSGAAEFLEHLYLNIESGNWPSTDPRDYFDGASWHPYPWENGWKDPEDMDWVNQNKFIYAVISRHGDEGIPVYFSECGYSDILNPERYEINADWMHKVYDLAESEFPWLWGITWFRMLDEPLSNWSVSAEKGYGIMQDPDNDYRWKPSAFTYDSFSNNYPVPRDAVHYYEFNNIGSTEGFTSFNVDNFRSVGGLLYGIATTNNPQVMSPVVSIDASDVNLLMIRMSADCGDRARFYFITDDNQNWDSDKVKWFIMNGDGKPHTYTISLSQLSKWDGTVEQFRISPTNGMCNFSIDSVRIQKAGFGNIISMSVNNPNPKVGDTVTVHYVVGNLGMDDNVAVKCGPGYLPEKYIFHQYLQQKDYALQNGENKTDSCSFVAGGDLFEEQLDGANIAAIVAGFHNGIWDETKYDNISISPLHKADIDVPYGSIDTDELFAFIDLWKQNQAIMEEIMGAIGIWKGGRS